MRYRTDNGIETAAERGRQIDAIFVSRLGRVGKRIVDDDLVAQPFEPADHVDHA